MKFAVLMSFLLCGTSAAFAAEVPRHLQPTAVVPVPEPKPAAVLPRPKPEHKAPTLRPAPAGPTSLA